MRDNFDALREAERLEEKTETDGKNKLKISGLMMIDGMEYKYRPHQSPQDRQNQLDDLMFGTQTQSIFVLVCFYLSIVCSLMICLSL
jgi:G:T-mismatch repair DNA endonuclease (very short patch repair protein)